MSTEVAPATPPDAPASTPTSDNFKDLSAAWASAPAAVPDTTETPEVVAEGVAETAPEVVAEGEGKEEPARAKDGKFAKVISVEHNGVKYELPPDLPMSFKVNGEMQTRTLEEALKANSAAGAVSQAKEEARLAVRGAQAEIAAAKAEATAVRAILADIRANPALADRIINDPEYAALFDEAAEGRVSKARDTARGEASTAGLDAEGAQMALGWIMDTARDYPGVDPDEVRTRFAAYLGTDQAQKDTKAFTPERVRQFFEQSHDKVAKVLTPLQEKVDAQAKEIAELKAAILTNAKTAKVLERDKAPPVGAGGPGVTQMGSSVSGAGMNLRDASAKWASSK